MSRCRDLEYGQLVGSGAVGKAPAGAKVHYERSFVAAKVALKPPPAFAAMPAADAVAFIMSEAQDIVTSAIATMTSPAAADAAMDIDSQPQTGPAGLSPSELHAANMSLSGALETGTVKLAAVTDGGREERNAQSIRAFYASPKGLGYAPTKGLASSLPPLLRRLPGHCLAAGIGTKAQAAKLRLVFDPSRGLNKVLCKWPFRYTSHARILLHVRPGSWLASVGVASGFHHLVIDKDHQQYSGVRWAGQDWVWHRVPFGVTTAPAMFSAMSGEVVETMARRLPITVRLFDLPDGTGIFYDVFMDDIL